MQILGLLTLARSHQKIVDLADVEIASILNSDDKYTHFSDAIYDDSTIEEVLTNMKIKVKK